MCPPPHPVLGGRGTLAGERGVGRVPIPTRVHTLWYSLHMYFVGRSNIIEVYESVQIMMQRCTSVLVVVLIIVGLFSPKANPLSGKTQLFHQSLNLLTFKELRSRFL